MSYRYTINSLNTRLLIFILYCKFIFRDSLKYHNFLSQKDIYFSIGEFLNSPNKKSKKKHIKFNEKYIQKAKVNGNIFIVAQINSWTLTYIYIYTLKITTITINFFTLQQETSKTPL